MILFMDKKTFRNYMERYFKNNSRKRFIVLCWSPMKKPPLKKEALKKSFEPDVNYSPFLAYFFLNLSILPAVSTNIFLPVKKGCDIFEISSFTRGYSLPSSHFIVSLDAAVERLRNEYSLLMSLKTTRR